ncbi:MAG: phytoene desaturase family protein [Pedobacter sp.]|jgi:phytoene desaturase
MPKVIVIGSGFSGLSSAAYLSAEGYEVLVLEKNATPGGRGRQLKEKGYIFDMGPSWYWMPDVFEKFFNDFGHTVSDFYTLKQLSPSFDVVFDRGEVLSVPSTYPELESLFESIEKGSGSKLRQFMNEAKFKYETGMGSLVYKPGLSWTEFADLNLIKGALRLQVFSSFRKHVKKFFSDPKLIALMEFPVLFLGAMPQDTPALYSLMNYAGLKLGTWYPDGGFGKVIEAMMKIGSGNGVEFRFNSPVDQIILKNNKVSGVMVNGEKIDCDALVASSDYHHTESKLLPAEYRNYQSEYWNNKTFAPSCLIFYVGLTQKIKSINHHTLFFDEDLEKHAIEIYKNPKWPDKPLFYICCPSRSDHSIAPDGHENLFFLMPLAPGLNDEDELREKYFRLMLDRLQKHIGEDISGFIDYKKSYCVKDFINDYNSFKGNAYGLANTLMQTAILKPSLRNKKLNNLFYTGQLTVPGPGVPPAIISGKVAAGQLHKSLNK